MSQLVLFWGCWPGGWNRFDCSFVGWLLFHWGGKVGKQSLTLFLNCVGVDHNVWLRWWRRHVGLPSEFTVRILRFLLVFLQLSWALSTIEQLAALFYEWRFLSRLVLGNAPHLYTYHTWGLTKPVHSTISRFCCLQYLSNNINTRSELLAKVY